MDKAPETITLMHLEVIVMPNGEILCLGKNVGRVDLIGQYLSEPEKKEK
jgi:hypothetical protein